MLYPGSKYPHYATNAELFLYTGDADAVKKAVSEAVSEAEGKGKKAGVIDFDGDADTAARLFFKELRRYDSEGTDVIFAAGVPEEGVGSAVMSRMRSAAGKNVINV
ncbi:MAG: hypothetical protein HFE90_05640 [Firmicutes bacterium]|nr:hypothetical protein [Bacillota bacterium]